MNTAAQAGSGNLIFMFMIIVFIIIIMWSGRGQKKREAERQAKVDALQKGDEVVLPGGIVGTVAGFKDNAVEVKVAENVKITVLKSGIVGFLSNVTPINKGGAK